MPRTVSSELKLLSAYYAEILHVGHDRKRIADLLGLLPTTINGKLTGVSCFSYEQIEIIKKYLEDIAKEEIANVGLPGSKTTTIPT